MREMGASPADIEAVTAAMSARPDPEAFELYAENVRSWDFFAGVCTQWQYAGMSGVRTGLNYAGARVQLDDSRPRRGRRQVWDDMRLIERAVLQAEAEQAKKKG